MKDEAYAKIKPNKLFINIKGSLFIFLELVTFMWTTPKH